MGGDPRQADWLAASGSRRRLTTGRSLNYLLIVTSTCALALLACAELARRRGANVILLALIAESLILVQGQALYVLCALERHAEVSYPGPQPKLITHTGFSVANLCVMLSVLILSTTYVFSRRARSDRAARPMLPALESLASYAVTTGVVALGIIGLVTLFGGLGHMLHNPGAMAGGQTLLLIALFWGKMPILHKTAFARRVTWMDRGIFLVTLFFLIVNSRLLALIALTEYAVLRHYRSPSRRPGRQALLASTIALLVVFVYGTLRNFADLFHTYDLRLLRLYYVLPAAHAISPLALLYEHGESAFSGFAGIVSIYCTHGLRYDFGLANLQLLLHLLPNAVRKGAFGGLQRWVAGAYPYHGSILPGGYEAAFAHFGFVGVAMFSVALGWIPARLDRRLRDPGADAMLYALVAGNLLTLFILDWWGVAFFLFADIVMLYCYRVTLIVFRPVPFESLLSVSSRRIADA